MPERKKPSKPTQRSSPSRARRPKPVEPDDDFDEVDDARPIAVGAGEDETPNPSPWSFDTSSEAAAPGVIEKEPSDEQPPTAPAEPGVDRPGVELFVGLVGLLLALSVIALDWYSRFVTTGKVGISGWASGGVGPVIFFLGLSVVAIIALRRLGKPIAFPYETSTIIEGIGYLCVGLLLLKRFFKPPTWEMQLKGWFISIILSAALFLLAGMMSASAPLVMKPGWFQSRGGKLGAFILAFALLAGAAFGFKNEPPGPKPPKACGQDFPFPKGVAHPRGVEVPENETNGGATCSMYGTPRMTTAALYKGFDQALKRKGWAHSRYEPKGAGAKLRAGQIFILIKDPDACGMVTITGQAKSKIAIFVISYGDGKAYNNCKSLPI